MRKYIILLLFVFLYCIARIELPLRYIFPKIL